MSRLLVSGVLCTALTPWVAGQLTAVVEGVQVKSTDTLPNLLFILADDVGVDEIGAYGENQTAVHTPRIDALAQEGLLFRNAWVTPGCSPTRAMLLTGRYPHETGIGRAIGFETSTGNIVELSPNEPTLADRLAPKYKTAAFGKWHLSLDSQSGYAHPLLMGFEHHSGAVDNFTSTNGQTYDSYLKAVDGVPQPSSGYATSETVDDALAAITSYGQQPWFAWVAFNSAHAPYHKPPKSLHTFSLPPEVWQDPVLHMKAMVEAMDTEIGRLLDGLAPVVRARTVVVFMGDNGTPAAVSSPVGTPDQGKGSLFESGLKVPLIVAGPGVVQGDECAAIVSGVDLLATFAELGKLSQTAVHGHSISMVPYFSAPNHSPLRSWVYSERFSPNGFGPFVGEKRAARTSRHKLIVYEPEDAKLAWPRFYDLSNDPHELVDLLTAEQPLTAGQLGALALLTDVIEARGELN